MRMKKIGLLGLALVLALALTGLGFAHWSQTLYIEGTVDTGTFTVGLRDAGVNDLGLDPGFDRVNSEQVWYTKDVANITSENYGWNGAEWVKDLVKCTHEDVDFYEKEVITITNAYPSYAPGWTTEIANCGTIPAKVSGLVLDPPIDQWPAWIELIKWEKYLNGVLEANGTSQGISGYTPYPPGPECYDALVAELLAEQLHPCDVISVYVELHFTQFWVEMPMDADFSFTTEITYTQWNLV